MDVGGRGMCDSFGEVVDEFIVKPETFVEV